MSIDVDKENARWVKEMGNHCYCTRFSNPCTTCKAVIDIAPKPEGFRLWMED